MVIRQGDEGDLFCVVKAGAPDVLAAAAGADGPAASPRVGSRSAPRAWPAPPSANRPPSTAPPARPPSALGVTTSCGAPDLWAYRGIVAAQTRRREWIVRGVLWGPDFFGEKTLMSEDVHRATRFADADAKCPTVPREDLVRRLGNPQDLLNGPQRRPPTAQQHRRPSDGHPKEQDASGDGAADALESGTSRPAGPQALAPSTGSSSPRQTPAAVTCRVPDGEGGAAARRDGEWGGAA